MSEKSSPLHLMTSPTVLDMASKVIFTIVVCVQGEDCMRQKTNIYSRKDQTKTTSEKLNLPEYPLVVGILYCLMLEPSNLGVYFIVICLSSKP